MLLKQINMTIEVHNCYTDQSRFMSFDAAFNFWLNDCGYNVYPKEEWEYIKEKFRSDVQTIGAAYYPYTLTTVNEGFTVNPNSNTRHLS